MHTFNNRAYIYLFKCRRVVLHVHGRHLLQRYNVIKCKHVMPHVDGRQNYNNTNNVYV